MTLQFRRGTDSDRLTITPSAGEPIWTTDTEKLYVGDGSTAGGILATGGTGGTDSATVSSIITATVDSAYINARTDANLDSASTLNLINAAYIQANQITYNTSDFADSAFVTAQINNLIDGAPGTLNTLNEIAAALNDDDSAYGTLVNLINTKSDLDSADALNLINASYIQSNQITYNTSDFADSAFVTSQINAISIPTLGNDFVDSAQVQLIVDSAYVQLRQAAAAAGTDSATVSSIIAADVDSAYIQARQSTVSSGATTITTFNYEADSGQTTFSGADIDGASLTYTSGKLNVYLNGILLIDSNDYTATNGTSVVLNTAADSADTLTVISYITQAVGTLDSTGVTNLIDAAYINARVSATDSATVSAIVAADVDSAYVQARQITYTIPTLGNDFVDSGQVTSIVNASYIQSNQTTYNTSDFADSAFVTSQIAAISIPTLGNDFVDSSAARGLLSGGTGVTYNSSTGEISIGQAVGTTDSAVFASLQTTGNVIVGGNLQVTGTTTTVNSEDLNVTDHMIYMNAGESAGSPTASIDVGWAANVNDNGSYTHVGMFRDASDDTFKVFGNYTPEPDAAAEINTGHASFALAPFAALTLSGKYLGFDSDVTAAGLSTTSTDSATVSAIIAADVDSAYIQLRQSTVSAGATTITTFNYEADSGQTTFSGADIDGASLTYTAGKLNVYLNGILLIDSNDYTATNGSSVVLNTAADSADTLTVISYITQAVGTLDSAATLALINSSYIQSNQTTYNTSDFADSAFVTSQIAAISIPTLGNDFVDSGQVTNIINAAYIQSNQTTYNTSDFTDSAFVTSQIAAISIPTLGNDFVDSGQVTNIVDNTFLRGLIDDSSLIVDGNGSTGGVTIQDGGVEIRTGTGSVAYADFYCEVSNAHRARIKSAPHASYSGNVDLTLPVTTGTIALTSDIPTALSSLTNDTNYLDSTTVQGVINASYIQSNQITYLDSDLITQLIDSAYVQLRQSASGGGGGTVDSADIIAIVDSAYVQLRQSATGNYAAATTITQYDYEADSAQTTFGGADIDGATLSYTVGRLQVFLNGILLVDSNDYTATNGSNVVLASGVDSGDTVSIISYVTELDNLDSGISAVVDSSYVQARVGTGSVTLAYDANLQGFVDAFTLPTSDGSANQVLVTNGSGTISFAEQSGGLDSSLITQLIDSAYVQLRQTASGGGGTDSASVNTLIDAKLQVLDVTDLVGADGNNGQLLKSLGNGEAEWTDLKLVDYTPASNTATGTKGELVYDSNYMYMCIATNTWRRIAWTDSSW